MSEPVASARDLCKTLDAKRVLHDLRFDINAGDVIGILGRNGAGKTTLIEVLLGFSPVSSGSVRVFGYESLHLPADAKRRIGYAPQQDDLIEMLPVAQQMQFIASFYDTWDGELAERLAQEWQIPRADYVSKLSVGQRQKLSLMLALAHRPDLLVLDEPAASLDPISRRQFIAEIVAIAADANRAVLLSSHIVSDIERVASKVWIMKDGRFIWQGSLDELKESVVRLHVRSATALPPTFSVPHALYVTVRGTQATAVVRQWQAGCESALAQLTQTDITVEHLGLEDLLLELHR